MAGRRTNLALLALLVVAVATGALAFALGTASARIVAVLHGAAGIAMLLLAPWKSAIARRGLRRTRPRSATARRATSLLLAVVVVLALGSGFVAALAGYPAASPISPMQVHVGAALVAVPLVLLHARRRPQRVRRTDLSRRSALRLGLLAGTTTAAYASVEGVAAALALPGASRRFTGSHGVSASSPEAMPVTQWLSDRVPALDVHTWRLRVTAGGSSRDYTYEQLLRWTDERAAPLDCTGGWYSTWQWRGVRLDRVLPSDAPGRSVEIVSATGYRRRLPRREAGGVLLATAVGDVPLSPGHGFPLRLVVPGRRGFWWVKWIVRIEVLDTPSWAQPPFPLQ